MKNQIQSLLLVLACVVGACAPTAPVFTPEERRERLVAGAASLDAGRDGWLEKFPRRKITTMEVPEEHLPTGLREMGYTAASVDDDHVILVRGKDPVDGVLVFTGEPVRLTMLEHPGVRVQDTGYPEIKDLYFDRALIERNAVQDAQPQTKTKPLP